jgi:DNA-binding transcriptional MerR regulator
MKRKSRKTPKTDATASHNGVYRLDELAVAFDIPRSVIYLWTIQEKLVEADYPGRSKRPSLYLEKSAAAIYLIRVLQDIGMSKADIKKFLASKRNVIMSDSPKMSDVATIEKGYVSIQVRIGVVRSVAKMLLRNYVKSTEEKKNEIHKKPRSESSPVPEHHGEPVEGAQGLASV